MIDFRPLRHPSTFTTALQMQLLRVASHPGPKKALRKYMGASFNHPTAVATFIPPSTTKTAPVT